MKKHPLKNWHKEIFLILLALIIYIPSMGNGYIWDDDTLPLRAQELGSINGLKQIWFDIGATAQYYPLTFTSYWIENTLWGSHPAGYHITNIILHALAGILIHRILLLLKIPGAWLCAIIFIVHPINVESVAWIAERKNTLSTFFYMSSLLLFLKFIFKKDIKSQRTTYIFSLLIYLCALLSKTVSCSLPAAIMLILYYKDSLNFKNFKFLIPFFFFGIGLALQTMWIEKHISGALGEEWDFTFIERCLIAGRAICFYIYKLFLPINLSFNYPRWSIDTNQWWQFLFPFLVLISISFSYLFKTKYGKSPFVTLLLFIGTLFPALGFVNVYPMRYSFVADHFLYLPSIFMIVFIVSIITYFIQNKKTYPKIKTILFSAIVIILSISTWIQQRHYRNEETLWRHTIKQNPKSWIAYNNLGNILERQGKINEAFAHIHKAYTINPKDISILNNYGKHLALMGRYKESENILKKALSINEKFYKQHEKMFDSYVKTLFFFAELRRHEKKFDQAIQNYQKAIDLKPDYVAVYNALATILNQHNKLDEAQSIYLKALELDPHNYAIHLNLGSIYQKRGQYDQAITHYKKSLKCDFQQAYTHFNLATCLKEKGAIYQAKQHYQYVIHIQPSSAIAQEASKELKFLNN